MRKIVIAFSTLALAVPLLGGCMKQATENDVTAQQRTEQHVRNFQPPPGKAMLYIIPTGDKGIVFADVNLSDVLLISDPDNRPRFYALCLPPGRYDIRYGAGARPEESATVSYLAEAGAMTAHQVDVQETKIVLNFGYTVRVTHPQPATAQAMIRERKFMPDGSDLQRLGAYRAHAYRCD